MAALGQVILAAGLVVVGTPEPLGNARGVAVAAPALLSAATQPSDAPPKPTPAQPTDGTASAPGPANSAANEAAAPATPGPARRHRPRFWLPLGALLIGAGFVTALLLTRLKSRTRPNNIAASPAADDALAKAPPPPDESAQIDSPATALAKAEPSTAQALDSTSRLSRVDIVETLVEELTSADSAQRRHAIWELGQRGHSAAIQPLVNGLLEADSQEKSLIFAALAEISSRNLKPMHRALALGLQDPSPEVRKNAIRDLAQVYDPVVQLSHMLAHAAQDPDLEVQKTAQWALDQLGRIAAAPYPSEPATLESAYDGEGPRLPPGS